MANRMTWTIEEVERTVSKVVEGAETTNLGGTRAFKRYLAEGPAASESLLAGVPCGGENGNMGHRPRNCKQVDGGSAGCGEYVLTRNRSPELGIWGLPGPQGAWHP